MTEVCRVAAHTITPQEDGSFIRDDEHPFDAAAYSLMKYGDSLEASRYGLELGDALIEEVPEQVEQEKAVFTVPSFVYAPKPASAIMRAAMTRVNEYRTARDIEPARVLRLYNSRMGTTAYAKSSLADREAELKKLPPQYHIPSTLVEGAAVFAVDDCIITGQTERKQTERIAAFSPAAIICAYAVAVDPEKALEHPGIEQVLNTAANPDLTVVEALINERRFALNSRVLDMVLDTPDTDALEGFFKRCPADVLQEMYESTMNSSLEFIERYPAAIAALSRRIYARMGHTADSAGRQTAYL